MRRNLWKQLLSLKNDTTLKNWFKQRLCQPPLYILTTLKNWFKQRLCPPPLYTIDLSFMLLFSLGGRMHDIHVSEYRRVDAAFSVYTCSG